MNYVDSAQASSISSTSPSILKRISQKVPCYLSGHNEWHRSATTGGAGCSHRSYAKVAVDQRSGLTRQPRSASALDLSVQQIENRTRGSARLILDVVEERGEGGREGHRQAVGPSGGPEQCRRRRRTASRIRSKADQRRSRCALEPDPQSSSLPAVQKFVALTAPSPPPSHPDAQEDPTATTRGRARCGIPCAPDPGSAARVPSTARPTPRARRDPPRRRAEEASWSRAGTLPRIPRCSSSH